MKDFFESVRSQFHSQVLAGIANAFSTNSFPSFFSKIRDVFDEFAKEGFDHHPNQPIACKKGCSFCCYIKVSISAYEIFPIVEYLKNNYSTTDTQQILSDAKNNSVQISKMSAKEQLLTNIKCPLLVNGICVSYPVRPLSCRSYHSTKLSNCEDMYEHPELDESSTETPSIKMGLMAATKGINDAFTQSGYDSRIYDLSHALIEGIENPKSFKRWRDKKTAFPSTCLAKDTSNLVV